MVAYTFQPEHAPLVLDGSKDFTLRKVGRKRHARVGERAHFDTRPGGGAAPPFATGLVVFRARVVLGPSSLLRVYDAHVLPHDKGEALSRLFTAAEQGAYAAAEHLPFFAQRDGFAGWDALFAWHEAHQGGGRRRTLLREVVGWADVEPFGGGA